MRKLHDVCRVSRIVVSANGMPSYHGRTSALFEENSHDRPAPDSRPRMPEEWVEKGLVAEAARQRQLEEVNFRLGKLEFDGVDPELGMHLLSLHWNRQHHSFLITYRPAFIHDMACGGPYFSKLLLNAIYFGAAKFSPRQELRRDPSDVRTAGWQFRQRVRELLGGALDRSKMTTIQALLVMTNSLFALGDERSAAWLYAGLASRMIVDLGLHVDVPDIASARKRVFWGAFVVDKIQSLYQGPPASIKESDTLVPLQFLDTFEELEPWTPFAYSTERTATRGLPSYSVSTFRSLCQLSSILSDILSCIYTERSFNQSPAELSTMLENLHSKLIAWHRVLPDHLDFDLKQPVDIPPPHVLSLHASYNVLMILLHRPFVADGHLYNTSRSISVNSFISCATAASNIAHVLRAYDKAFSVRRAPYLISYSTYVAATIHVRIAAKRGLGSDAHSSLETCLAVFRENQETNGAVRRANAIVQNLMKRMGVSVSEPEQLQIEKDLDDPPGNHITAGGVSTSSTERNEPGLHSLGIDGIIKSLPSPGSTHPSRSPHAGRDIQRSLHPQPPLASLQNRMGGSVTSSHGFQERRCSSTLPHFLRYCTNKTSPGYLEHMEAIRLAGSVMMGLAPNVEAAKKSRGTPKLAIVSPPPPGTATETGVSVLAFSMGQPHPSLQLTGAVCLAAATCIEGAVAHQLSLGAGENDLLPTPERTPSPFLDEEKGSQPLSSRNSVLPDYRTVRITHSSGAIEVEAVVASTREVAVVERCTISRTPRRLFKGEVYYYN
ncbi:nitrate assimilation regulatory protein nirA [Clohesyomyces aquaticus]|uniref:Nitrate assimilation regulatory protein nirA n=1 Tax=Clohesyomyces aquaticus TaxID=1231657 RepID=A0A1Y1Z2X0_9PLEO|nr:nitrate assimilation regulatory protein nirA [Clohesyomyces aquaticus]